MDQSIITEFENAISVSDDDYTLTIDSKATQDFDTPFQVSLSFGGYDTSGYIYVAPTVTFLFRPEEAKRAYLEPFRQHFSTYHSSPFWFFPTVQEVGSCESESKMIDYDWDKDQDMRMYCKLYELEDPDTVLVSSQYGSCIF